MLKSSILKYLSAKSKNEERVRKDNHLEGSSAMYLYGILYVFGSFKEKNI